MQLNEESRWASLAKRLTGRVLPRVAVIVLVFVGLQWWMTSPKQAAPTIPITESLRQAWDGSQPRKPGLAVAIVWDRGRPASVDKAAYAQWEMDATAALERAYREMIRLGSEQSQSPVRIGVFSCLPSASQGQAALVRGALAPPASADLAEALRDDRWQDAPGPACELLVHAVTQLSLEGLDRNLLVVLRHPGFKDELANWPPGQDAWPPSTPGPRLILLLPDDSGQSLADKMDRLMQSTADR